MFWNLQEVAVNPLAQGSTEMLMVLESPGSYCDAIIDGLESTGGWREAIYRCFPGNIDDSECSGACCETIYAIVQ